MKDIPKIFVTILVYLLLCSQNKIERTKFQWEKQCLLSKKFEMMLPSPFHRQIDAYGEGVLYIYSFPDTAYVIVHEGYLLELPFDSYCPQIIDETNIKHKKKFGFKDNKYWRKDVVDGVNIYYGNVSVNNKIVYDSLLNSVKITTLN